MKISKKIIKDNEEIKLDVNNIVYKDLQGVARSLGWGVIVERGENEDGSYVKYGNGFMECWHTLNLGSRTTNGSGTYANPFRTGSHSWKFPEPFVEKPIVIPSGNPIEEPEIQARASVITIFRIHNLGADSIQAYATSSSNKDCDIIVHLLAKGRWK